MSVLLLTCGSIAVLLLMVTTIVLGVAVHDAPWGEDEWDGELVEPRRE